MKKSSRLWKKTEDGLPLVFIDYDFVANLHTKSFELLKIGQL